MYELQIRTIVLHPSLPLANILIDCLAPGPTEDSDLSVRQRVTGSAAMVAAGFIALLCSRIGKVMKMTQPNTLYTHTAVVEEVLKETTQFNTHNAHRGYGLLTADVFSFCNVLETSRRLGTMRTIHERSRGHLTARFSPLVSRSPSVVDDNI